jgi:hypothetical protein
VALSDEDDGLVDDGCGDVFPEICSSVVELLLQIGYTTVAEQAEARDPSEVRRCKSRITPKMEGDSELKSSFGFSHGEDCGVEPGVDRILDEIVQKAKISCSGSQVWDIRQLVAVKLCGAIAPEELIVL